MEILQSILLENHIWVQLTSFFRYSYFLLMSSKQYGKYLKICLCSLFIFGNLDCLKFCSHMNYSIINHFSNKIQGNINLALKITRPCSYINKPEYRRRLAADIHCIHPNVYNSVLSATGRARESNPEPGVVAHA